MAMTTFETTHAVNGLAPIADALSGTVNSDIVSMENYGLCTFFLYLGARTGTTADTVLTVQACDDFTPTTTSAKAFNYKIVTTPDTQGALTASASSGFTTTSADAQIYQIEIEAAALGSDGPCVRLHSVEATNDPQVGAILILLSQPRFAHDVNVVATS